jgi:activator of 2-hydroxyglutaryl-CoA dehydratase
MPSTATLASASSMSSKIEELKASIKKLKKKGKYNDLKKMKKEMVKELQDSNALGTDLGQHSKLYNELVMEILEIHFDLLKNRPTSVLL